MNVKWTNIAKVPDILSKLFSSRLESCDSRLYSSSKQTKEMEKKWSNYYHRFHVFLFLCCEKWNNERKIQMKLSTEACKGMHVNSHDAKRIQLKKHARMENEFSSVGGAQLYWMHGGRSYVTHIVWKNKSIKLLFATT